jgi:Predicted hydrolases or acyltransferases (alpha/beta hydrolase superfamily)
MQEIADVIVAGALSGDTRLGQPVTVAMVRESIMRQDPEGYAQSCEALAGAQPPDLQAIACPTLLVTGDEDGVAPPQSVRMLAERIAGARTVVYSRCGHWTPFERAADCLRELKSFYASSLP